MQEAIKKANILLESLPYIQAYHHKIIVIKYGGNAMIDETLQQNVIKDIVLLKEVGIKIVLVHGGGPNIDQLLKKLNKEIKFVEGLRYTDKETMDVVQMVLAGKLNKDLVSMIQKYHQKAIGISGIDGGLIKASPLKNLGYVGHIEEINEKIIFDLLAQDYIPVISSIGSDGECHYNINADIAAAKIAAKLKAENFVLVSNIPGVLENIHDESSLIPVVSIDEIEGLKQRGIISKGMIPKIECCQKAIEEGVKKTCIIDGRMEHALLIEILSKTGIGTMIVGDKHGL